VLDGGRERIPPRGRLIIVANHPLGGMDALALLRLLLDVRPDVRIVANELLMAVAGLAGHLLPVAMLSSHPRKSQLAALGRALEAEAALVIFPAGNVSRLTAAGVRDPAWLGGAAHLARRHHAPVLPVFIEGWNSWSFYLLAAVSRTLGIVLLPRQLLHQRGRTIRLAVGHPIPAARFADAACPDQRRHDLYRFGRAAMRHSWANGARPISSPAADRPDDGSWPASTPASASSARSRAGRTHETSASGSAGSKAAWRFGTRAGTRDISDPRDDARGGSG
jgi:1-acyl-sn-glycerol-3-phosphate acyltransferase